MEDSIFFRRESKRSFLDKPVPEDVLARIWERVRWSPSCNNNQPWRFVVVTDPAQHKRFMECVSRGNQWADRAPILVAICARQKDDYTRDDDPVMYYQFGCGLAVMSLLLASVQEGLLGHPMAGYDAAKLHDALDIPSEFHVICIIALGYPGSIELLSERDRPKDEAPRTRKPMAEILCRDRFSFAT